MLNALDTAGVNGLTINDAQAMVNGQLIVDVVIIRARDGYMDDQHYIEHRNKVRVASNPNGGTLWGTYSYLGYTAKVGSHSWTAKRGDYQAQDYWNLTSSGGIEWSVLPAIDIENLSFLEKQTNTDGTERWVRQVVPMPEVHSYADNILMPAFDFLGNKLGREPIFYSNPDKIKNYLAPLKQESKYDRLWKAPLWLADYNPLVNGLPAWWSVVKQYFPNLLMHQFKGDVRDWPGVTDVDLNRIPGTRAQLKAWLADKNAPMPAEGAPDPIDPPIEPPASGDLEARVKALEEWQRAVRAA